MYVEVEFQLEALRMSAAETPAGLALEVAAPRVECTEKILVSMAAECITLFSQWPIVAALTGLWGLRTGKDLSVVRLISPHNTAGLALDKFLGPQEMPSKRLQLVAPFFWS